METRAIGQTVIDNDEVPRVAVNQRQSFRGGSGLPENDIAELLADQVD
jgi:hypothetical protein